MRRSQRRTLRPGRALHPCPSPIRERGCGCHAELHPAPACGDGAGDADRRRPGVPDAAPDAGRPGRDHRRRQCQYRAGGADPVAARARPADGRAVLHLARQHPAGRFRRELLLQEDRRRADPRPARADGGARPVHDRHRGPGRGAARRPCRLQAGHLDRPHRDGLLGVGLFGAGVRHRLCADLSLRDQAQLGAGARLSADRAPGSAASSSA